MGRPDRTDAAVAVGAFAAAALAVAVLGDGVAEWLFFGVLAAAAGLLGRSFLVAWRHQRDERRTVRVVRAIDPDAVAAAAVRREREELFDDISRSLVRYLERVRDLVSAPPSDGRALARRIRGESHAASNELRRQLGLLRDAGPPARASAADEPDVAPRPPLSVGDLVVGTLAGALGLVEALVYRASEDMDRSLLAVLLTAVVAFALTWRRVAPTPACVGVGALFAVGAVLDDGLISGLWMLATIGGLVWASIAGRGRGRVEAAAAVAMVVSAGGATSLTDPENAGMTWAVLFAVVVASLATRVARELGERARAQAVAHADEVRGATSAAVAAERHAVARELHDVVSHAVGLISMQAAAAEVTWTTDRAKAESALDTIRATALSTLAELRRFHPGSVAGPRSLAEVEALIRRIESAGTAVDVSGLEHVPPDLLDLTYRVLQESLTNTLRHARGARVTVDVTSDGGSLRLRIADDGPGSSSDASRGYGLVGLRERVALAGGDLEISSPPSGGFVVAARLPIGTASEVRAE